MSEWPRWSWVQVYVTTWDGQWAYLGLQIHYLGDTFQSHQQVKADQILDSTYYDGTKQNSPMTSILKSYNVHLLI